jgi:RNA polymerase primary sigma factor
MSHSIQYLPDLSADCERAVSIIDFSHKKFKHIEYAYSKNNLVEYIVKILDSKTTGEQDDIILISTINFFEEIVDQELDNLTLSLSEITNLEPLALRTEAGLIYSLNKINNFSKPLNSINKKLFENIPGSRANNNIFSIYQLLELEEFILSGRMMVKLNDIWINTSRKHNFDKTVISLSSREQIYESLCWSILRFESNKHTNLVWHEANKLERTLPNRTSDDLLSYGYMGLRTALRLYDPTLGFRFSTYACARINGTIRDGVRAESPIPKRLTTFQRKVASAESELTQVLRRQPTIAELVEKVGEDISKFSILPKLSPEASIDSMLFDDDGRSHSFSWEASNDDPSLLLINSFEKEEVYKALHSLKNDEKIVIDLLIIENLPLTEISTKLGLTVKEVKVIRDGAFLKLRKELYSIS